MEYLVIIERDAKGNFGAFVPQPGINIYATGKSEAQVRKRMAEGLKYHLEWMRKDGDPIPRPTMKAYLQHVDVPRRASANKARKVRTKRPAKTAADAGKSKRR